MIKINTTYKVIALSMVLIGGAFAAWGIQHALLKNHLVKAELKPKTITAPVIQDPVLLTKYEALFKKYDTLKTNVTMAGRFNIVDRADSTGNMKNVDFLFCKAGDDFYYKLGFTETVNSGGLYICVDNASKTIIVSPQKKIAYDQEEPIAFANLTEEIKTEGYELSKSTTGNVQTISLHNEHNINCKLFSITYDTTGFMVKRMYARMTNIQEPLNKDKEKLVDINITDWSNQADLNKYYHNNIVSEINGAWKGIGEYKGYTVTRLE